jgi:hypothetical protein
MCKKSHKQLRLEFNAKMKKYQFEGKSIVYIDENGFSHESTRSHGYAKIGERCLSQFNWGAKGRTNAIGALLRRVFRLDDTRFITQTACRDCHCDG